MMPSLLAPRPSLAALFLRLGLAAIFIVLGYSKSILSFQTLGEQGFSVEQERAIGWVELVCGLLLLVGLLSRLAALVLVALQAGAIFFVTGKYALMLVWFDPQGKPDLQKVGPEYNLVLIAMCLAVVALGSGLISLDYLLKKQLGWDRPQEAAGTGATSARVASTPMGAAPAKA